MRTLEGNVIGNGIKVGIVAARFNEFIVSRLIGGAEDALVRHGCRGLLRFRWWHRRWHLRVNMTL